MALAGLGLGALRVLQLLSRPPPPAAYQQLSDGEVEEKLGSVPPRSSSTPESISMFSRTSKGDAEEYHCGWVYVTPDFYEIVRINMAVLQDVRNLAARPTDVYFMVLEGSALRLYSSERQDVCMGVTSIEGHLVDIYPHSLLLDEIYRKEYPIRISNPAGPVFGGQTSTCYVYAANASEKEDWLLALRRASGTQPEVDAARAQLDFPGFMEGFAAQLGALDADPMGAMLSSLAARVMFNIHTAAEIEALIKERFAKKTATLPRPFFVGDLELEEVCLGRSAPILSNGRVHSVTHHGEWTGSVDVFYGGGLTLKIKTAITSPVHVPVGVNVQVRRLSGRLMLKMKPPPSDRLWYAFYRLPDYDLAIEPVVSSIPITWSFVQSAALKKVEEALLEFVVLPNMDDLNVPPLVLGGLFVGERPFELEPVPRANIQRIVDPAHWSAESLSRRSPSRHSLPPAASPAASVARISADDLGAAERSFIEQSVLRARPGAAEQGPQRKIMVTLDAMKLPAAGSPLLASLQNPVPAKDSDGKHE